MAIDLVVQQSDIPELVIVQSNIFEVGPETQVVVEELQLDDLVLPELSVDVTSEIDMELGSEVIKEPTDRLQDKTVIPAAQPQRIRADLGYGGLGEVTVEAIPNNYGLITYNGSIITVS